MDSVGEERDRRRDAMVDDFQQALQELSWTALQTQAHILRPYELTIVQAFALKVLAVNEAPIDMARLAELTSLPPSTITNVVDRLERDGLAERGRHPTDRRRVMVVLTPAGEELLRRLDAVGLRLTRQALAGVDDNSIASAIRTFRQMNAALESLDDEPGSRSGNEP